MDVADYPDRKKCEDSFFGLHFDFHAKSVKEAINPTIGKNTNEEMIRHIIEKVKPDYIQIDCKGHPGIVCQAE